MEMDRIAAAYKRLLDKKDAYRTEYKRKVAELDTALDELEGIILQFMKDNGLDTLSFDEISFSPREKIFVKVDDWQTFYEFVKENDAFDLLKKGVKASEIEAFLETTGQLPPAVGVERQITLSHRRK